ncbi:hypothetical protein [Undibacterium flavidum]|uniref:Uncharacterized protein n=1 Tax=Undibacterium flavidum TaxID=2762297 RepID=A0ABR6YDK6_9BURK|nr:hypothetical protein [Undibacterium flavidum]MBC3874642.1 hypothetical protein [Undibacterium flavidum]
MTLEKNTNIATNNATNNAKLNTEYKLKQKCDSPEKALLFVQQQGIVLVSAKGPVPRLTEEIVGEPIKGSWWAHPQSHHLFKILEAVSASDQILVCRLMNAKLTLVHRRLWPSLVRIAGHLAPEQLAQVREQHTPSGRHVTHEIAFPDWVPAAIFAESIHIDENAALDDFSSCFVRRPFIK